jgi:hypothetical protein
MACKGYGSGKAERIILPIFPAPFMFIIPRFRISGMAGLL